MALNREIWIRDIVEAFVPDDSFLARSVNHSEYVNDKTVHVPQAGAEPNTTKNRNVFPATIKTRTDGELTYDLDIYDVEPLRVRNLADVELSYDKRKSMLSQSKKKLQRDVAMDTLKKWVPSSPTVILTVGAAEDAHIHATASGQRYSMTKKTVMDVRKQFDMDDVPDTGRVMLLDAIMYNQLLNSLTDAEVLNFLAGADPIKGVIGTFLGFSFMKRSSVFTTTPTGVLKTGQASATDCAGALAWQEDCVSRALGDVQLYEAVKDPTYYGDIFSFAVRAGGKYIREDKKGIVLISQGTPA